MLSITLDLVCCPVCRGRLELPADQSLSVEVGAGELHCVACGRAYPIRRGIPHLYLDDNRWSSKAREAQGWVDYHKELGIYEQPVDAVDLQVPYYPEQPWISVARSFDIALRELDSLLVSGSTVLDLGAGRGWAAKHFALRGCRSIAVDIVPDENVGLGRAWALMRHANVTFEPIIADAECLPFASESFDLVFCAASLHHTSDLPLLMRNIYDTLKPGGRLCAINEPCIPVGESAERVLVRDASPEIKHGINERRPNLLEYEASLAQAGFTHIKYLWSTGYHSSVSELENFARDLGAAWPTRAGLGPKAYGKRWGAFLRSRVRMLSRRRSVQELLHTPDIREQLMRSILMCTGGEVILLATKTV